MRKKTSGKPVLLPDNEETLFIKNMIAIETEIAATEQMLFIAERRLKELKQARADARIFISQYQQN